METDEGWGGGYCYHGGRFLALLEKSQREDGIIVLTASLWALQGGCLLQVLVRGALPQAFTDCTNWVGPRKVGQRIVGDVGEDCRGGNRDEASGDSSDGG